MRRNINRSVAPGFAVVVVIFALSGKAFAEISPSTVISHSALARLVRVCAPQVNSTTQAAIVAVESGGSPWVLHDDNDDRVYSPTSLEQANTVVNVLLARDKASYGVRDRGIDVGLAQINSENFMSLGVTASDMLDPCSNLHASAQIIASAYEHERTTLSATRGWRGDEVALERALQDYNSGRPSGDDAYVRAVFLTLNGSLVREVGSGVRIAPLPILPMHFDPFGAPASSHAPAMTAVKSSSRRNETLFYHAANSFAEPAAVIATPTGSIFARPIAETAASNAK